MCCDEGHLRVAFFYAPPPYFDQLEGAGDGADTQLSSTLRSGPIRASPLAVTLAWPRWRDLAGGAVAPDKLSESAIPIMHFVALDQTCLGETYSH
jgi:hypothetical protein